MGQFADIRPYNNDEILPVFQRLTSDDELVAAIAALKLGGWHKLCRWLVYPLVRYVLKRQLAQITTVKEFQQAVKSYMDAMVDETTSQFTVSGLDDLDPNKAYLFISNHRDIALDPAFVNYALYENEHDTVRIAIGDNLLTKPYVSDLMRLNKSFIVKRSAKGPRQIMAAYKLLSGYIRHSIEKDNSSIWIAQREGRAKDGNDATEPAIIKMIAMSMNKKTETFSDYINDLHIVPVAISYEFDPCDSAKAKELHEKAVHGSYEKDEHEDVASIATGISGKKGHVHVSFGAPLMSDFVDAQEVATAIDEQIIGNYVLHPTNIIAYKKLYGHWPEGVVDSKGSTFAYDQLQDQEKKFIVRINAMPSECHEYALGIYANPVLKKIK